ncbi:MAG: NAD(P)-dependent oxidoreductase [Sphingobacteriaceae bacterium]|nr:NAD(P)-dependent oxidoreductase [Cytophagaceae bacterium]
MTGAGGFLGRAVATQLMEAGYSVLGTGRAFSEPFQRLHALFPDQFTFQEIPETGFRPADFSGKSFASVVHLASFVPTNAGGNAWENFRDIQRGTHDYTLSLLDALDGKTAHLVFTSSVTVYGKGKSGVFQETDATEPTDPYGFFKLAGEGLCRLFAQHEKIPCAILRPTQVYGPGEPHGLFFQKFFIPTALRGETIWLLKGGREVKDLLWIDDAARAFAAAVGQRAEGIFNVSSGVGTSVREIAEGIQTLAQNPLSEIQDDGAPVLSQVFANEKMRQPLGITPEVSIAEGLQKLWQQQFHPVC